MKRIVPWEGSKSSSSSDYLVVITDPRPKSVELRTAMKRLTGSLAGDVLKKCLVINTDTPAENRRFAKNNFKDEGELRILCDENMEFMREYTALGEKVRVCVQLYAVLSLLPVCLPLVLTMAVCCIGRHQRFSITMFVLREGRVEKIAREVDAEVLTQVLKNAIRSLT